MTTVVERGLGLSIFLRQRVELSDEIADKGIKQRRINEVTALFL